MRRERPNEDTRSTGTATIRGGFWEGTPFSVVAETLPRLATRITSPVMRRLAHLVLTAEAEPAAAWKRMRSRKFSEPSALLSIRNRAG